MMGTGRECLCCNEIATIAEIMSELEEASLQCITEHPGFTTVCLDIWVLQTAYYQYHQHYGAHRVHTSLQE